ncbi:MAG: molybdenum cofactor biosynthesis protein B [Chloroflexota bacterium]
MAEHHAAGHQLGDPLISVGIITVSDKASRGEREDLGGPAIREVMLAGGAAIGEYVIVPDEIEQIAEQIKRMADDRRLDVVFTTGGTGLASRDVTPQATTSCLNYDVPGIAEAMRAASLSKTPAAMTSRAVAGVRGRTLIINLPGSPKGVRECLEVVLPALPHAVSLLRGEVGDHQRPTSDQPSPG